MTRPSLATTLGALYNAKELIAILIAVGAMVVTAANKTSAVVRLPHTFDSTTAVLIRQHDALMSSQDSITRLLHEANHIERAQLCVMTHARADWPRCLYKDMEH